MVGKKLRVYTLIIFTEITKLFERIVFVELFTVLWTKIVIF